MCRNTSYLRVEWLLKYFFDCKCRAWELVNNIKMFCGKNIYFIYNGLLSWRFYWRAVTGSRHWVMSPGYLGIRVLLQRPPRDLDLSSEGLISWATVYWAYHISPSKWKYTNDLVVVLLLRHSIQFLWLLWIDSGSCFSFVFLSSSLGDCPPQILLVPYSCASCLMTFGIKKQNSRVFLLWGVRPEQNCKVDERYLQCPQVLFQSFHLPFGNISNRGRPHTVLSYVFTAEPYKAATIINPILFLLIMKQVRNSSKGTLLEYKVQIPLRPDLVRWPSHPCWSDLSFLEPLLLPLPCTATPDPVLLSQMPAMPYMALIHLDLWAKIQIYLTWTCLNHWQHCK